MAGESQKMEAPPLDTESIKLRRSRFVWRSFLVFNLALGAYIFSRPAKKDTGRKEIKSISKDTTIPPETSAPAETSLALEELILFPTEPEKVPEPLTKEQKREVLEWILEEKRNINPQNREEKRRINEEKALLKQFIRAESIPKF